MLLPVDLLCGYLGLVLGRSSAGSDPVAVRIDAGIEKVVQGQVKQLRVALQGGMEKEKDQILQEIENIQESRDSPGDSAAALSFRFLLCCSENDYQTRQSFREYGDGRDYFVSNDWFALSCYDHYLSPKLIFQQSHRRQIEIDIAWNDKYPAAYRPFR